MKGIPIKFRGKDVNGTYVYGDLLHSDCGVTFIHKETLPLDNRKRINPVTIARLIGYDADGKEVYEDDKLILGSHEYIAGIRLVSYTDDKKYFFPEKDFSRFLLKE